MRELVDMRYVGAPRGRRGGHVAAAEEGYSGEGTWVSSGLAFAMSRSQFVGLVVVQPLLFALALASSVEVPAFVLFMASGTVVLTGVATLLKGVTPIPLLVSFFVVLGMYLSIAPGPDSLLFGVALPLAAFAVNVPIMLWPGTLPVLCTMFLSLDTVALIAVRHDHWPTFAVVQAASTIVVIVLLILALMSFLRNTARSVDQQKQLVVQEQLQAVKALALRESTAEYIRVLHDTMINTFGALAREQEPRASEAEVRDRCRRDLERINSVRQRSVKGKYSPSLTDLDTVGLPISWTGLSGDDIRRYQALLPARTLEALFGCACEAILNSTKHSGATTVQIDVQCNESELLLEISDEGRGFDRGTVTMRGIATSLFARAREQGITVSLDSVVGSGTTVKLACPMRSSTYLNSVREDIEIERTIHDFKLRMVMSWMISVTVIGSAMEIIVPQKFSSTPFVLPTVNMVVAGALWAVRRSARPVPNWFIAMMIILVPGMLWCASQAADANAHELYLFRAMSLTVLPMMLYVASPSRAPFITGLALQVVGIISFVAVEIQADQGAWQYVVLLGLTTLSMMMVLYRFLRGLHMFGIELKGAEKSKRAAREEAAAHQAAAEVHRQWSATSLQQPFELLEQIADGTISPYDSTTRVRCSEEEAYLRHVSSVPPGVTLMSWWLALSLAEARVRSVNLQLHMDNPPIDQIHHAEALGLLMLECISSSTAASELTISILQQAKIPHLLIVGSDDSNLADCALKHANEILDIRIEALPGYTLVEAVPRQYH